MVKLNKIYTKTGDDGSTGLADGSRVAKYSPRVFAYGDVDEANSSIGVLRVYTKEFADIDAQLTVIQNDMFDVGADLATPETDKFEALRVSEKQVERIEQYIDELNADLEPLTSFVLPGGTEASAFAHLARTVVRKAERYAYQLAESENINEHALKYLNRLSDYLFVLARKLNNNGKDDVLWVPGENR